MAFLFKKKKKYLIALILLTTKVTIFAAGTDCQKWEDLPVRQGGRIKPLYVQGRQSMKFLIEKPSLKLYCQLALSSLGKEKEFSSPPTLFPPKERHQKVRKLLGLKKDSPSLSYDDLLDHKDDLAFALRGEKAKEEKGASGDSSYKRALQKLLNRIQLYENIQGGTDWTFMDKEGRWVPLANLAPITKSQLTTTLNGSKKNFYQNREGGVRVKLELFYAKSNLHLICLPLILLSLLLLTVLKSSKPGLGIAALCVLVQVAAIALRVVISGRAPITNMYETVLFSGWGALVISFMISAVTKEKIYIIAGLGYNFLCTLMINFAHGMLSREISPLVPVLRDNFWLSTHVTTVILSYASFAISWILANIILIQRCLRPLSKKELRQKGELIYTCLKVGTVLLSLGIILGGIWADYSWGRFWGWDPKETWSAIALCLYLVILHGKYTDRMTESLFISSVAAAFMGIMMAWFGVNYVLSTGLHSYGFSSGGALFLTSFFSVQIFILIGSSLCKKSFS